MSQIPIPTSTEAVIDQQTGHMRPSWRTFFEALRKRFATAENAISGLGSDKLYDLSGVIQAPEETEYPIWVNASHGGTITAVTTKAAAGTCTVTVKINGVALGGSPNAASTTEQTQEHASANAFAAGDDISIEVSANTACEMLSVTIRYGRSLS